jgi:XTP/dITP diphosphohydrolase
MKTLVLATRNKDKIKEISLALSGLPLELKSGFDFSELPAVEETGSTLKENAFLKARAFFLATGLPTLADDTGLEIDALGGAPGVFSSRFSGPNATYAENVTKVLAEMKGIRAKERKARFRCVITLVFSPADERRVEGVLEGSITVVPIGAGGFGYDPIFYVPELERTLAELSLEQKNRISHRGRALEKARAILAEWAKDNVKTGA